MPPHGSVAVTEEFGVATVQLLFAAEDLGVAKVLANPVLAIEYAGAATCCDA